MPTITVIFYECLRQRADRLWAMPWLQMPILERRWHLQGKGARSLLLIKHRLSGRSRGKREVERDTK